MSPPERDPSPPALRVTAAEREAAVKRLTAAFSSDAIAVDEFERRVAAVYAAETTDALAAVTRDLPEETDQGPGVPARTEGTAAPAPGGASSAVTRAGTRQISSVVGSIDRRIEGPMPERLDVRAVAASVELDLRRAEFPAGVTEIRVRAVLASVELELPEHVRIEHHGQAILGNFSVDGRRGRRDDDAAPVVRITGSSILADVEVELDD